VWDAGFFEEAYHSLNVHAHADIQKLMLFFDPPGILDFRAKS
jgi:hypothetical protein